MKNPKVLALVGGISSASLNKRLYHEVVKHNNTSLSFCTFDISSLPFYSQDIESAPIPEAQALRDAVAAADAVLFITPEYNRSIPGVLKNAIDWASRPYGHNLWAGKPGGLMGASGGAIGTFGAQRDLRHICAFLDIRLMNQPEYYLNGATAFDAQGLTPSVVKFTQAYLSAFESWILHMKK